MAAKYFKMRINNRTYRIGTQVYKLRKPDNFAPGHALRWGLRMVGDKPAKQWWYGRDLKNLNPIQTSELKAQVQWGQRDWNEEFREVQRQQRTKRNAYAPLRRRR